MNSGKNIIKTIIAVILFLSGSILLGAGVSLLIQGNIGAGIFGIIFALALLVYPILKVKEYVANSYGKKRIVLPVFAVAIPLSFTCCFAAIDTNEDTKSSETTVTETSETTAEPTEEGTTTTTTASVTQTPVPTETTTETTTEATEQTTTTETTVPSETTTEQTTTAEPTPVPTETTTETTTEPTEETTTTTSAPAETTSEEKDYVLNKSTMKYHRPGCSSISRIKDSNKEERHCRKEDLEKEGYEPCGNCHP